MRLGFLAIAMLVLGIARAQFWAKDFGGTGGDRVADVKVGADGFVYAVGEFSATMDVNGSTYSSTGGTDVFVAKLDDMGNVVWLAQAGGYAIDRAGKIAVDDAGHLVVTGQFMATADLFGTSATSSGNTFDFYVAQLSTVDGSAQWVRTGGGGTYADKVSGLAIAPNGTVVAAGEFRGTADFDGTPLASMPDPLTIQPSVDVFVAAYSSNGVPLWLKHGQAEFTDRAIDVVADANSNFYVGGQFSDTIQFDAVHTNAMYNSIFLLKLDAAGNEQWFRRCGGGTFNHVRDLQLTSTNQLLVAGDQRGGMLYVDAVPQIIPATDDYNYFLLRVGLNGQLLADTSIGSQNPINLHSVDQRADTVAVFGEFECQFTGFSTHYDGNGLFMATGPQDLFVAKHRFSDWSLVQAQQFGGQEEKRAGGIASLADGNLVFGGAYHKRLFIPADDTNWGDFGFTTWCAHQHPSQGTLPVYCGDSSYVHFAANQSAGMSDGFLSKGFVRDRQPYDVWTRFDTLSCFRDFNEVCVREYTLQSEGCLDSLVVCGTAYLYVIDPCGMVQLGDLFSHELEYCCLDYGYVGWDISFLWSTGDTTFSTFTGNTGWVWCTVFVDNGCWQWTDSMYVVVNQYPPEPLISDSDGQNISVGQWAQLDLCDSVWVWYTNPLGDYSAYWLAPDTLWNDSAYIGAAGALVHFVSPEGCTYDNWAEVNWSNAYTLPNLSGASFESFFVAYPDTLQLDTVRVCEGGCVAGFLDPTWYVNGIPTELDSLVEVSSSSDCGGENGPPWQVPLTWSVYADTTAWYQISVDIVVHNFPCGSDSQTFTFSDSVFVIVVPFPEPVLAVPFPLCPGDSVLLSVECQICDSLLWADSQGQVLAINEDSLYVHAEGFYRLIGFNTEFGQTCPNWALVEVLIPTGPDINIEPGLVCTGDSALLWTTALAFDYQWLGPGGPIALNNDSVWVTDFGDYFLTVVDFDSCELTNGPIELGAFASPYLDVQPDYVLCPGDSVTITVFTNDTASIVWDAPLSGSATSQTITQAGLYSCTVGSCTPQTLTAFIVGGSPNATILPEDTIVLCLGDSVQLSGANGEAVYLWDAFQFQQSFWASGAGSYQLVVFDEVGCTDTAIAVVSTGTVAEPLVVEGDTVCQGSDVVLTGTGSGQIYWFADAALSDTIGVGSTITIPSLQQSTIVYVLQVDSSCAALAVEVGVPVIVAPTGAGIAGPGQLCVGDSLVLAMTGGPYSGVAWQTPDGSLTGDPLVISPVQNDDAGTYVATPSTDPCVWGSYTWDVVVVDAQPLDIGPDTTLCDGLAFAVELPNGFNGGQWSNGSSGNSSVYLVPAVCWVSAMDGNGCTVSDTLLINGLTCVVEVPNIFSPNGDGSNDVWLVTADGFVAAEAVILSRWGQELYTGDPRVQPWNGRHRNTNGPVPDGVYYFVLTLDRGDGSDLVRTGYIHLTR